MSLQKFFVIVVFASICCGIAVGIIGGQKASTGDFPNAVAILIKGEVFGGGTLVSPIHVITSCQNIGSFHPLVVERYFKNRSKDFLPFSVTDVTLVAGTRWIYSLEGGQSRKARDSYPHPACTDTQFWFWLNDLGVIETNMQFYLGQNLHAMYYWTLSRRSWKKALDALVETESVCTVMGWGRTSHSNFTEWLNFGNVRLVSAKPCVDQLCGGFAYCGLTYEYFEENGKLCVLHLGQGQPSGGDLGNALFCGGYYYGLLSKPLDQNVSIYDSVVFTFDLYRTVVREAQENKELSFPMFSTFIEKRWINPDESTAALHICNVYMWLIVLYIVWPS